MAALQEFKAELFKALGHPVRLPILELLNTGEKTVSELQAALDIEASSVSPTCLNTGASTSRHAKKRHEGLLCCA